MAIKTFNLDNAVYRKFCGLCRAHGVSMSKQVEFFMRSQLEGNRQTREEYLRKLEIIRKGKFVRVKGLDEAL